MTGATGDDTFNALYSTTNGMTFGANDVLDGGAGNDTLYVQVGTAAAAGPATIKNIETVTTNFSAAGTVNLLGATGVKTIETNGSSAAATFTNIGDATVGMKISSTDQGASFGFTTAAVAGAADTANVTLAAATGGTLTLTSGFETLSLTSTGSANTLAGLALGTSSASTVRVGGDQALSLGTVAAPATLPTTVTTFDASGNTATGAGVIATFGANALATAITGGTGNDTFVVTNIAGTINVAGGAGNDTIIDNASIRATDTLAGGDGTGDVLATTAASAEGYATPTTRTITGFERLTLTTPGSSGVTLTTANVDTGIATVTMGAGTATQGTGVGAAGAFASTNGAYGITGPAGTLAVTLQGALGGALTLTDTGTATTDAATVTVSPSTAALNVLAGAAITSTGYETLTISSGSASTAGAQTLGAVTLTPDTGGTTALRFTGVNNVSVGAVTAISIDASGMTGAGTFTQTAAAGSTTTSITGTANADTIRGGSAASTLSGGAGADSIVAGAGNDSVSGGDGADTINGGAGKDTLTGGAGADYFVFDSANTSTTSFSNSGAPDTITDFVSGTDKIQITGQTVTAFLGNFTSLQAALAAAGGLTNRAFFVTGESNLYVVANGGAANPATLANTDMVISLTNVSSLTAADLLLGSQGTGSGISITAANASLSNTSSTGATAVTTTLDDTITSTQALFASATIDGGIGRDTLTISGAGGTINLANVSNVEVLDLSGVTGTASTVTNASTAFTTFTLSAFGDTVTTSNTASSVTGGALNDNITGGTGNDTLIGGDGDDTLVSGGGNDSLSGGAGADTIRIASPASTTTASVVGGTGSDILSITGDADANLTGLVITTGTNNTETLNFNASAAARVYTINASQLQGFSDITRTTIGATNVTIAVQADTAAKLGTGLLTADNDVTIYTITGAAGAGLTVTPGTAAGIAQSITGGAGNDVIDYSSTTAAVNQTLIGGAGNDTIKISAATFTNTDTVQGGTDTDTLEITGNGGLTITLPSGDTGFENIVISGATSGAISITTDAATIADGVTLTVTTSQTTGALTFNASASDGSAAGKLGLLSITGGGGDDLITGTGQADTINGGAGSDTILGGLGADSITTGSGNNQVEGGEGNDTITLTGGGNDNVRYDTGSTEATATIHIDTIVGFEVANDVIGLSIGDLDSGAAANDATDTRTLSTVNGVDINAAVAVGGLTVATVAPNATTTGTTATLIKFSSTTSTSFASAIGTGTIATTDAANTVGEGILTVYYDATNARAVLGIMVDTSTATANIYSSADTFVPIAYIGMSTADYGTFGAGNLYLF